MFLTEIANLDKILSLNGDPLCVENPPDKLVDLDDDDGVLLLSLVVLDVKLPPVQLPAVTSSQELRFL